MTATQTIRDRFWKWLDFVTEAIAAAIDQIAAPQIVRLTEGHNGRFAIHTSDIRASALAANAGLIHLEKGRFVGETEETETMICGGRVELLFQSERFLFKPLELPSRAAEFLDGVVRAQIDRLTPWNSENAAFGFSKPVDAGTDRISVTVAATPKATITPYLEAFAQLGARSITVLTRSPEAAPNAPAIIISEGNGAGVSQKHQIRRILAMVLAAGGLIAAISVIAATIIDNQLETRQDAAAHRIAVRRASLVAARNAPGDPRTITERALARRKNETPSIVIALEALSQVLPDNTYATELRVEANKLRLIGVSQDPPALIRLLEQSRHFASATFFAPTTRAPSDPGDRFNIEARIEPVFQIQP